MSEFSASWRARGLGDKTLSEYVRHLRAFEAEFNDSFLNATRLDLSQDVADVLSRLSPATAAYKVRAFKSFYSWLVEQEEIAASPAAKLRTPTVPEPVTKIASPEDVRKMLATCREGKLFKSFNDARDGALIHVLRSTGLRIGEAARIDVDHVLLEQGTIIVPKAKTRKPRVVGLDTLALRRLAAYLRRLDENLMGTIWRQSNGSPLSHDGVKQIIDRRARRAGVKVTPHQLRRAFAADWMRRGGSQSGLQTMAGWSSGAMVRRYVSAQAGELAVEEHRRLYSG